MKTKQAKQREHVRWLVKAIESATEDCQFWFRHRFNWSNENGGYNYCRERFQDSKQAIKLYRRLLVSATARYLRNYKGN